jgi:hypothetical protein
MIYLQIDDLNHLYCLIAILLVIPTQEDEIIYFNMIFVIAAQVPLDFYCFLLIFVGFLVCYIRSMSSIW